jgi:2-polyprenyl-3-methyl-5-hydroxy-6-metoxy-1,4-benzoquinol methylase
MRYPIKNGPRSSHSQVIDFLSNGSGRQLLDVGCAQGDQMIAARSRGWVVTGIEPDSIDANFAKEAGFNIYNETVENALIKIDQKFDAILLADVLEHLQYPEEVLKRLTSLLTKNGRIIASVPNVAHISVRLLLLVGKFDYTLNGILDKTHLKFFTSRTVRKLFSQAGLKVLRFQVTPVPLERVFPKSKLINQSKFPHLINQALTNLWPKALGYQFVIEATIANLD